MTQYIARRLLLTIPVLLLVSIIVFALINLIPGDPALLFVGNEAGKDVVEALRKQMGLDRPLVVRYMIWLNRLVHGDLGNSVRDGRPVLDVLLLKLPVTVELAAVALVVAWMIAIPAGVLAAWKRRSMIDYTATTVALAGISIPNFWLGIMLIYLFAVNLRWLPPSGYIEPWIDPVRNITLMIMPATVLGTALAALVMRLLRSSMLEVMGTEYIRTANAKGLSEQVVLMRHALKNAMIPVATVMGLQLGGLLGGAVITETIFAVPGIGRLAIESILTRDYPMVQGVVLFSAMAIVFVNFAVDVVYSALDPRIRLVEDKA
ncbi:MAG: ABC transporter permease [Armatimonadota bacterium]